MMGQFHYNLLQPGDRVRVRINRMIADHVGADGIGVLPGGIVTVKRSSDPTLLNREEVYRIATEFGADRHPVHEIRYPKGSN